MEKVENSDSQFLNDEFNDSFHDGIEERVEQSMNNIVQSESMIEVKKDFAIEDADSEDYDYQEFKSQSTQVLDEVWENHLRDDQLQSFKDGPDLLFK